MDIETYLKYQKGNQIQKCNDAKTLDRIVNIPTLRKYLQEQSTLHCKKDNKKT